MKKCLSLLLVLLLSTASALAEEMQVYVSVSDDTGALVLAYEAVAVTDADADGVLTICDALACAHAAKHKEGAAAFLAEETEFGLSLLKLWGVDNGGSYGYYLNDASAWSLLDPVHTGDHVKAYAFADLAGWSDTYSFFEAPAAEAAVGAEVVLVLSSAGYDEAWNPVTLPVADAAITVNGTSCGAVTDAQGKAVLTFDQPGVYVVSAVSENQTLVPPVCRVTVTE